MELLIKRLWIRVEDTNGLLNAALVELAEAKGAPPVKFIAEWRRTKGAMF